MYLPKDIFFLFNFTILWMQMQINIGHNFSIFLINMLLTAFLDYSPKQMLSHIVVKLIIVLLCEKFLHE